jgi:hypothetical protein
MESTTGNEIDPGGVNHPAHYNLHPSGIECIDLIRELNFDIGSAVKYVFRRGLKGSVRKDLDKALYYLRDYLFEEGGTTRLEKPPFGSIGHRWRWDVVIACEPDRRAREFYLSIAREDPTAAKFAVEDLINELETALEEHPRG